ESFVSELAPRDVVARAIHLEREAGHGAFLDARAAIGSHFPTHFPTVFAACQAADIDPRRQLIPVAPAAHYHMGGIVTDAWGQTTLNGLSAVGECASTGAHGANRLASNSLLEAVVFAHRIAARLRESNAPEPSHETLHASPLNPLPADIRDAWRARMQRCASVVRDAGGLTSALTQLDADESAIGPTNSFTIIRLILTAALARTESRGGHFRSDFPDAHAPARTFLTRPHHPAAAGRVA
ncbi:MAG TPA: FAD-binding protein, partial [Terricaulis sp.]|nr:FAD-binding protein [Terricaulis sp.]